MPRPGVPSGTRQSKWVNISVKRLIFGMPLNNTHTEVTVSEIYLLGLSFNLRESRKTKGKN